MAAIVYTKSKEAAWKKQIDLLSDNLKLVFFDSSYVPDADNDEFLSIIPPGAIIATSGNLLGKTISAGVLNALDITTSGITPGEVIAGYALFVDTGVSATSRLVFYDTSATGLPLTISPRGVVTLRWQRDANKVMRC